MKTMIEKSVVTSPEEMTPAGEPAIASKRLASPPAGSGKRVLYIYQGVYPWEIRVEKICRALVQHGYEVTLLARWKEGQPAEEVVDDVRVLRVGHNVARRWSVPVSFNPLWHRKIGSLVRDWKPDAIIAREILLAESAGRLGRRQGIPTLIDMAEHYPATLRTFKKYQQNPLLKFLVFQAKMPELVERRALRWADGVMTVCEEQNHRLQETHGYPPARMAVVENTPELKVFAGVKTGPSLPARVFAYHGTMTPQRGLEDFVKGFALAAAGEPDVRLLLAGGGESYDDLVGLVHSLGIEERVRFTGRYRYEDLVRLYGETDIGVVPQPPDESCNHTIPNKLYDYLACGKPVIVSPAAPLKRVVDSTNSGIATPSCQPEAFAEAIRQIRQRDLARLSRNALHAAQDKYHWAHDVQTLLQFVGKFIRTRHSASGGN